MSYDLLLKNGSLALTSTGDFNIVTNYNKLVQDVIKIVTTPQNSNPFQPQLGSLINERLIGKNIGAQNMVSILEGSVQEALVMLQKLQKEQAFGQALSPAETLIAINSVTVQRDVSDPRQLNVILKVTSGDGNLVTDTFSMRLA